MLSISLIIIGYNSTDFIEDCLKTAVKQTDSFDNILVVDNNSSDDTVEKCKKFSDVNCISLNYNSGYSKAANMGIDSVETDLCVIANSDVKFDKDFVKNTVKYFEENQSVDILSPLLIRFDEKTVDSAGQESSLSLFPKEIGYNKKLKDLVLIKKDVFSVCGAATVFKRKSLLRLKIDNEYYDEDFFMFWEDFDIGWRANQMGMKTVFYPKSIVYHYRSGTLKKNFFSKFALSLSRPSDIKYHLIKNRYLTLIKNFRFKKFWFNIPFILIKDFIWVGALTISSPKIIIRLIKSVPLIFKAFGKRVIIKKNV